MKKIPTVFERDLSGDRSRVINKVHKDCQWVVEGLGVATRKMDGTCCLVRDNKLYKRRELRKGETQPCDFEFADLDEVTGKTVGWVPVGDGPEDKWHREGFSIFSEYPDGTYELLGPKIQANIEKQPTHLLTKHGSRVVDDVPRTFETLKDWLEGKDIEGIVFHHPDGRMAKIKLRDFGLRRKS